MNENRDSVQGLNTIPVEILYSIICLLVYNPKALLSLSCCSRYLRNVCYTINIPINESFSLQLPQWVKLRRDGEPLKYLVWRWVDWCISEPLYFLDQRHRFTSRILGLITNQYGSDSRRYSILNYLYINYEKTHLDDLLIWADYKITPLEIAAKTHQPFWYTLGSHDANYMRELRLAASIIISHDKTWSVGNRSKNDSAEYRLIRSISIDSILALLPENISRAHSSCMDPKVNQYIQSEEFRISFQRWIEGEMMTYQYPKSRPLNSSEWSPSFFDVFDVDFKLSQMAFDSKKIWVWARFSGDQWMHCQTASSKTTHASPNFRERKGKDFGEICGICMSILLCFGLTLIFFVYISDIREWRQKR